MESGSLTSQKIRSGDGSGNDATPIYMKILSLSSIKGREMDQPRWNLKTHNYLVTKIILLDVFFDHSHDPMLIMAKNR